MKVCNESSGLCRYTVHVYRECYVGYYSADTLRLRAQAVRMKMK